MSRFSLSGRLLVASALALALSSSAEAQAFRLSNPSLSVDGRRVVVAGAPLMQEPFGALALSVPGSGTYRVALQPFAGARPVGQFDGDGLFFAVEGRSVRLRSNGPILDRGAPATAYVRFDASGNRSARGMARVSVAPTPDARPAVRLASAQRGPAPPVRTRPDADSETARLRAQLDRVSAQRRALESERDRLRAERSLAGSATMVDARRVAAERDRLAGEVEQIVDARDRAQTDRNRLAAELEVARRRAEAAEASGRRTEALAARDESGRLRALVVARDETIVALQAERTDRDARLVTAEADLVETRRALYVAIADRDQALAARDAALARSGPESARVGRLETERDQLASERDRAFRERDALLAGRVAIDDDRAALLADRTALAAARARLDADRAAATTSALTSEQREGLADRQRLLDQLTEAQSERDALQLQVSVLQNERDTLRANVTRLRADLATERATTARLRSSTTAAPALPPAPRSAPRGGTEAPRRDGSVVYFPGFDFSRLRNPDLIRRRLDEAEYPRVATMGRIEGDVLVLFQTDREGRVIRTAVASPIGGGLDSLAESLVRDLRFVPPVVNGQPTGLRSQVLVRFEM